MADTSTLFTGTSRYASDFQNLIHRAVAIASLPLQQLQSVKSTLESQAGALDSLEKAFRSVANALSRLQDVAGRGGYSISVSNGTVLSASLGADALPGVWEVEVTSLGAWTSTLSKDGLAKVTDPASENISAATSFTLTVHGEAHVITPASATLEALVEAINQAGLDVEASIVNVGSGSSPDYRLAVRSTKLDAVAIALEDTSGSLLDTLALGSKAAYRINGMSTAIESDSRSITLAPGVTVTLLAESEPGVATTVTVGRSASALSSAFSGLVTAFNQAVDALDAHYGKNAGALAGQSIVRVLSDALRQLTRYEAAEGAFVSLADLGLSFDDAGKLSLDTAALEEAFRTNPAGLESFLGSAESGFLAWAGSVMDGLLDETDGTLTLTRNSLEEQVQAQDRRIEQEQERVDRIEQDLVARMAAADALIASLEQQANYINSLFESMRIASRMYTS